MIRASFGHEVKELMKTAGVTEKEVVTTINNRDSGMHSVLVTRLTAVHWFSDDRIIFFDGGISKTKRGRKANEVEILEVRAIIVIAIAPNMPGGRIRRDMTMPEILAIVAASFGEPVTAHPGVPPALLYNGPWDGDTIGGSPEAFGTNLFIMADLYPPTRHCSNLWAFDPRTYREWLARRASYRQ
jgi:hypothetical protein